MNDDTEALEGKSSPRAPHDPPIRSIDLPGTEGRLGAEPEDFRVDEIPAYTPSGSGEHRYVRMQKRGATTPELVRVVAEAAGVDSRDVGYAGLKDKHAVTTQWLSLPAKSVAPEAWALPPGIVVLESSLHANKLRTGHLTGNHFRICLTDVVSDALGAAERICERLSGAGLKNYFGAQRFGQGGDNLSRALDWLGHGARRRVSSFLLKMYPSVVQSEIFNRYLTLRSELDLDQLLLGEVVRLNGSGASFVVEDVEKEALRLETRDIFLTGPLPGPKMRPARDKPLELESAASEAAGADARVLETLARFAPGARRDLLVFPEQLRVTDDGPGRLALDFTLPAGSYATVLVREFTREPFLNASSHLD